MVHLMYHSVLTPPNVSCLSPNKYEFFFCLQEEVDVYLLMSTQPHIEVVGKLKEKEEKWGGGGGGGRKMWKASKQLY